MHQIHFYFFLCLFLNFLDFFRFPYKNFIKTAEGPCERKFVLTLFFFSFEYKQYSFLFIFCQIQIDRSLILVHFETHQWKALIKQSKRKEKKMVEKNTNETKRIQTKWVHKVLLKNLYSWLGLFFTTLHSLIVLFAFNQINLILFFISHHCCYS